MLPKESRGTIKLMDSITQFLSQYLAAGQSMTFVQMLGSVVVAYFGGVLASLTPCVYPMIPITVSVVGGSPEDRENRPWHQIWLRGSIYVLGMTVTYSFLGVLAGITGKVFGSFTNTSGWYLTLGMIMTLAALVMLDVVPFDPLVWWESFKRKFKGGANYVAQPIAHKEMTWAGIFVLGASSGLIAAPCTTPVLTSILAYIAKTQSIGLGLALMFSFSLGLGTLLLVIAGFTGAIQLMPRSGMWMKKVKLASGFILLIFAEYLVFRAGGLGGF